MFAYLRGGERSQGDSCSRSFEGNMLSAKALEESKERSQGKVSRKTSSKWQTKF